MENEKILEKLKENQTMPPVTEKIITGEKFVIFLIDDKQYALPENIVQEIIIDNEIYYLPFTPDYIRGLINRQGEPYTVIDIKLLFNNQILDGKKFIILRNSNDAMSFIITDILKIIFINSEDFHKITDSTADNYFTKSITVNDIETPVINVEKISKRIKDDLE